MELNAARQYTTRLRSRISDRAAADLQRHKTRTSIFCDAFQRSRGSHVNMVERARDPMRRFSLLHCSLLRNPGGRRSEIARVTGGIEAHPNHNWIGRGNAGKTGAVSAKTALLYARHSLYRRRDRISYW